MKFAEFASRINEKYAEAFPSGHCQVSEYLCLGKSININMYLSGKNEDKNQPMMLHNDMFKICLNIDLPGSFNFKTDDLPGKMVMECWSNCYFVKPDASYHACSSSPLYCIRKIPYRKTTGTAEKLVATVGKFIEKLHKMVSDDLEAGNIHDNFLTMVKENLEGKIRHD